MSFSTHNFLKDLAVVIYSHQRSRLTNTECEKIGFVLTTRLKLSNHLFNSNQALEFLNLTKDVSQELDEKLDFARVENTLSDWIDEIKANANIKNEVSE